MARLAVCGECSSHMVRVGGIIEVLQMASNTSLGCPGVQSVDMTRGARGRYMDARQRECRTVVIERRRLPCCRRMANSTIQREGWLCVLRSSHVVVVSLVTARALHRGPLVTSVEMA